MNDVRLELGLDEVGMIAAVQRLDNTGTMFFHEIQGSELVIPGWQWNVERDEEAKRLTLVAMARAIYGLDSSSWPAYHSRGEVAPAKAWLATERLGILVWPSPTLPGADAYAPAMMARGIQNAFFDLLM
jgi:hypothetical protein